MTLLIGLSSFSLLSACGVFLYWNLARGLDQDTGRFLEDKLYVVRAIIRDRPNDMAALDEETRIEGAARRYSRYYVRILDERSALIIETPGMNRVMSSAVFSDSPLGKLDATQFRKFSMGDGRTLAIISNQTPSIDHGQWTIQLALDISNKQRVLSSYRMSLGLSLFIGLALAGFAGRFIARNALRPIDAITRSARDITAAHLDQRVRSLDWPKELVCLASAFDAMLARLEAAFARLAQFSADIAHELRTPVTNLMTAAQVTLSRPRVLEEYRQVLESNVEELGNLAQIIDSLLFMARAETEKAAVACSALNARREIENVIEFHRANAEENGVALICEGQAHVFADSTLFQRAISNLLSNAVRHTARGGSVTVSIRSSERDTTILVSDTGEGISSEHLPHLFDRFYRADPSRAHRTGGFGLGLALVRSIVELHQGQVRIDSALGRGTSVAIAFPSSPAFSL
jgi:two-component system heavy metal sensor histidine kinase CusS